MIAAASATTTAASAVSTLASAAAPAPATRSTAAITAAASAGTAAPAFTHRPGFVYHQRTAQKILAIAGLNGSLAFFVVAKFREPETTRLTGKLIADYLYGIGLKSVPGEPVL
jgi:hypothetical protein